MSLWPKAYGMERSKKEIGGHERFDSEFELKAREFMTVQGGRRRMSRVGIN